MQRDQPGPVRPRIQHVLVPQLRLRTRIGKHQRGGVLSISAITGPSIWMPRWPPQGKRDGGPGSACRPRSPWRCAFDHDAVRHQGLARALQVAQGGRHAPHQQRRIPLPQRASASCACTPRLLPISSCHSSTITMSSCANCAAASGLLSSSVRLSGVVTSASGRRLLCRARWADPVSPVRASICHGRPARRQNPAARARCRPPAPASA
jgi:hypothetical protein